MYYIKAVRRGSIRREEVRRMGRQAIKEEALTVTLHQAADLLGISYYHIYMMMSRGEIPVIRLGKAMRVSKKWIEKTLEGNGHGQDRGSG
jgi:excisionase family DNA binding protein